MLYSYTVAFPPSSSFKPLYALYSAPRFICVLFIFFWWMSRLSDRFGWAKIKAENDNDSNMLWSLFKLF